MRYCRFLLDEQAHYGVVEDRGGEPCIVDLARAPEEDLNFRLTHGRSTSLSFSFEPGPLSEATLLAGHPLQDRLRGPQLSRPRQGDGQ